MKIPRGAGDVEEGIGHGFPVSFLKSQVEAGDTVQGLAGLRVFQESQLRGEKEAGDPGVDHGVVKVADDAERRRGGRHHDLVDRVHSCLPGSRPDPGGVPCEFRFPRHRSGKFSEIVSLLVGFRGDLVVTVSHHHLREGNLVAFPAPVGVQEILPPAIVIKRPSAGLVGQQPPGDHDFSRSRVSCVGGDLPWHVPPCPFPDPSSRDVHRILRGCSDPVKNFRYAHDPGENPSASLSRKRKLNRMPQCIFDPVPLQNRCGLTRRWPGSLCQRLFRCWQ